MGVGNAWAFFFHYPLLLLVDPMEKAPSCRFDPHLPTGVGDEDLVVNHPVEEVHSFLNRGKMIH